MLFHELVVIDVEGFFGKYRFIVIERSVHGGDYQDTLQLKGLCPLQLVTPEAHRITARVTKNFQGLIWDSGFHDYNFLFCYLTSLKLRFQKIVMLSERLEKCNFLQNFLPHIFDSNQSNCPKGSEFPQTPISVWQNHQCPCLRDNCVKAKANLIFI